MADSNKTYVDMLVESLKKKVAILTQIEKCNDSLKQVTSSAESFEMADLDQVFNDKEVLIEELSRLDDGFQNIYNRVKEDLTTNKAEYSDAIHTMQDLIRQIVSHTTTIEADEQRIKVAMEKQFSRVKQAIKTTKANSKAVSNYYQNMAKMSSDPQFMDRKK